MKKKWIVIGVIAIIVGLIGFNIWKSQATTTMKVKTASLKEETMKETVMTPGTLTLNKEQEVVYEGEKGKIAEFFVSEGDTVKKGDQLLRYENDQLELEKQQVELQIRSIYLELEKIRKQHKNIDKQLEKDKDNELLQEEHDQITLQQQMTAIELERTNLQKEAILAQMEDLIVVAEVDGTVLVVNEKVSSSVQMGEQAIIRIGSLGDVAVEGTISEYDTLSIKEGQRVRLTSDAVSDKEWKGKVSYIGDLPQEAASPGFEASDSSVLYPISVTIDDEINLKPGFKMLIEIVTSEEKVNTLPVNAIQQKDDKYFVYIVEDGKAKRVDVNIGSVDSEKMEIKEGVTKDDKVIIEPLDDISDGMEVTVE